MIDGLRPINAREFSVRWRYTGVWPYTQYDRDLSIESVIGHMDLSRINENYYKPYHRLALRVDHHAFYK